MIDFIRKKLRKNTGTDIELRELEPQPGKDENEMRITVTSWSLINQTPSSVIDAEHEPEFTQGQIEGRNIMNRNNVITLDNSLN